MKASPSMTFPPHRRVLPIGNPLRAIRHEQDLDGGEDQLQVLPKGHLIDIHQVHFELIPRLGIIAAIDLGHAGQPGFYLQPQAERRHFLFILRGDFRPLRPGAHDAHIPPQNIENLRQLIQPDGADDAAHRRDPVIVVGGQTRHAVLFRIHPHGTEFQNFKGFPVLGEPNLLIKNRPMIAGLDGNRRNQHEWAGDNQPHRRQQHIQPALGNGVFRARHGAPGAHDRDAEGLQMLRPGNDDVARMGNEIAVDVLIDARLDDAVAQRGFNAGNDHRLAARHCRKNLVNRPGRLQLSLHIKAVFKEYDLMEFVQILVLFINHQRFHGRMQPEIQLVGRQAPDGADERLPAENHKRRPDRQQPQLNQAGEDIGDAVAEQLGQQLGVKHLPCPENADLVGIIGSQQENGNDPIAAADRQPHRLRILRLQQRRAPDEPGRDHDPGGQRKMQDIHASHLDGPAHFCHQGITLSVSFCFSCFMAAHANKSSPAGPLSHPHKPTSCPAYSAPTLFSSAA